MSGLTKTDVQELTGPLLEQVRETVRKETEPLRRENAELKEQITQASHPVRGAGFLFSGGHAPGVRTGEDPLTSRGYSLMRAGGMAQGVIDADDCKVELDLHQRLKEQFGRHGFKPHSAQSILIPLGGEFVAEFDSHLAGEITQRMAAGVSGANRDELHYVAQNTGSGHVLRQALSQYDDTGGGVFLGPTQTGEMIDLLRPREAFSAAGATQISLPPNGRLDFPKQTGASAAYWINEVPSDQSTPGITQSEPTTGYLSLMAKKLAVLIKSPNDLIRFGGPSVEAFFRNDMARVMSLEADLSMLEAAGSGNRVKGLLNYSGVQTLIASTVGANGDTLEPEDVGRLIAAVEEQNVDGSGASFLMRPQLLQTLLDRRAHVYDGSSTTELGPYLFSMNRSAIENGRPPMIRGKQIVTTTQVSNTRTKGSGTDLSYLLYGAFANWVIGRVGVMEVSLATQGDTAFTTDQTWLRAIQYIDAGPRHPEAFAFIDDLLTV